MLKFPDEPAVDYQLAKKIYLIIFGFSLLWLLLIFLAPLFQLWGGVFERISSFIYLFFSKVCHQNSNRSFHLFEHKLGVCSRCLWIYAGFFVGTIVYPFKYKLNNVNTPSIWFLMIPMMLLISDVIFDSFGIFMNTFFSRSLTGFFLGAALPLFIIPGFVKFFFEVYSFLRNKASI